MKKLSPKPDFLSFSFSDEILAAINKAGFTQPTDIQLETIPAVLKGKDVLSRANTGSGKTAAFVLPLIDNLCNDNIYIQKQRNERFVSGERANSNCVQILILVPTRELAIQVCEVCKQISADIQPKIDCLSVYGGVKINPQMMALRSGVDILVSTPGRLLDLVDQNAIKFNQLKTLVIDEVDRMMKGDFEDEITRITKLLPNKCQNLMFTATFPESIRSLVREVMNKPVVVNIDEFLEPIKIEQRVITVNHDKKNDLLAHLLNENDWKQVLIFCSAKRTCDNLVNKLNKREITAVAMHGNKEQTARSGAMNDFKSGKTRILIATDVAARGIDIESLPCVINFDLPRSPNDYTHRIGRTSRAGQSGVAISLIAHHEYQHFKVIEKHNALRLTREQIINFEADEIAPILERTHPKKKDKVGSGKKKSSKKKTLSNRAITDNTKEESTSNDQITKKKTTKKEPAVNADIWGKRKGQFKG